MNTTASEYLRLAADVIEERADQRDVEQERSMAKTIQLFNKLTGLELSEVDGWLFMILLKLVRSTTGRFNPDDLLDGAAYMALCLECEAKLNG